MFARNARLVRRLIFTVGTGFVLVLLLIGAILFVGLRQLAEVNSCLETIVDEHNVKTQLAFRMRGILRDRAIAMLSLVVINEPFEKDDEMMRFYGFGEAYQKTRQRLENYVRHDEERVLLANIDRITRINRPVMIHTVDLAMDGHTSQALEVLEQDAIFLQHHLVRDLDNLIRFQRERSKLAADAARHNYIHIRTLMLLLGTLAVLVAAIVAWAVIRRTVRLATATELEGTKYQTLFETNTDGIVILDDGGFIDCNSATLEMFHMSSREEFLACRPEDLGQAIQADGGTAKDLAEHNIRQALRQGHAFFEWIARRPDGSTFPASLSLHTMTLEGRRVIQAIMRDVSVQKESEDTLKRARDAALGAAEMKSQFMSNVSHEIRTPMNGILGMSRLLLDTDLTPRQRDYAESVATSAEALMRVINDVLDFSKIEAGRFSLEPTDFNLTDLLREVLEFYIPRTDAKGLALRLERHEGLADWVHGDALRLRQILLNLLDNAVKFTQEGEIRVVVESLAQHPGQIRFSVQDTGPGMSPEVQARVFQAFTQGDGSITRRFGGTGLGLTICRQLAELMGGSLELESVPDQGSRFQLTLPLPAATTASPPRTAQAAELSFPETRVLLAEDNPVNRKLTQYMLERLCVEVLSAADGKQAFDALRQEQEARRRVDLILMDAQMPEWDGLTATRAIRAWEHTLACPRLPILALTANAMEGFDEECRQAGMDGILIKPLQAQELTDALAHWLPHRARERSGRAPEPESMFHTPGEPRLFDLGKIRKICRDDPARIQEMLELFLHSTESLLDTLSQSIRAQDALLAARQAHQIQGAAAYLGARDMARHAQATEQRAWAGDCPGCVEHMEELESAFIALRLEIENALNQLETRG